MIYYNCPILPRRSKPSECAPHRSASAVHKGSPILITSTLVLNLKPQRCVLLTCSVMGTSFKKCSAPIHNLGRAWPLSVPGPINTDQWGRKVASTRCAWGLAHGLAVSLVPVGAGGILSSKIQEVYHTWVYTIHIHARGLLVGDVGVTQLVDNM